MSPRDQAFSILKTLFGRGVKHLVLCPGGRNAPFLQILSEAGHPFTLHTHFDERGAAFFALGLMQRTKTPVAVLTTSGTAVSETLSACVEAFYSRLPLVVVSADRPRRFRGSAAPQTIEQKNLLKAYCPFSFDLEGEEFSLSAWDQKTPVHVNVCFDEPLTDAGGSCDFSPRSPVNAPPASPFSSLTESNKTFESALKNFLSAVKKPLAVVSGSHGFPSEEVLSRLVGWNFPIYLEGPSELKGRSALKDREIYFPEKLFSAGQVDGVVRVGHVPTHRLWRDLETSSLPVLNFSHTGFSGLAREKEVFPLELLDHPALRELGHENFEEIRAREHERSLHLEELLKRFPLAEPALMRALQDHWKENEFVFLGNSLPIREWDLVARKAFSQVAATRGANGIDGQISTFLGHSWERKRTLGIFGDLTGLYDMNALWMLKGLSAQTNVAVINNGGGMIFERMFHADIYLNSHALSFEPLALFWKIPHLLFDPKVNPFQGESHKMIEVRPDGRQTRGFWKEWA
jgi:2-succinyl-5-enolpyruvyl-6-hydroxy-3-cyclohexene-1-carboxylate synthase